MNKLEQIVNEATGETKQTLEEFVHSFATLIKEHHTLKQKSDYIANDNRLLRKRLYGASSEKLTIDTIATQTELALFNEFEVIAQQATIEETLPPSLPTEPQIKSAKKTGRKALPAHLPRVVIEHDLLPEDKRCPQGHEMECIGTQVSEELDYVPAKVEVIQHRCKKYICVCCASEQEKNPAIVVSAKTAKKPVQLINKSMATPNLLAHIAVSKFCDHLPLYRQEHIFQRLSIELSRQTMSVWMLKIGVAIRPLVNLIQDEILNYDVAFADETTVQVLKEPNRRAETKSYMWCFLGGPPNKRVAIYQYHASRGSEVANQFFAGYHGALHCDGYGGYNTLIKSKAIIGLNCWAHVRRKFMEALPQGKEKGISGHVIRFIRAIYKIEDGLKNSKADQRTIKTTREQQTKPILDQLKAYLDEKSSVTLKSSKVGDAIGYTIKRWPYLVSFLQDGRYEIDNNRTERAIKPFVCGRNNWLFANSVDGAHSSASIYSLIETAKLHDLNPAKYLAYIFNELPKCTELAEFEALLPYNIQEPQLGNLKIST